MCRWHLSAVSRTCLGRVHGSAEGILVGFLSVRRASARADELSRAEYVAGTARLERLAQWLHPRCVCFVGVTGYRVAIDPERASERAAP